MQIKVGPNKLFPEAFRVAIARLNFLMPDFSFAEIEADVLREAESRILSSRQEKEKNAKAQARNARLNKIPKGKK